jgi:hypothetical protein
MSIIPFCRVINAFNPSPLTSLGHDDDDDCLVDYNERRYKNSLPYVAAKKAPVHNEIKKDKTR